MWNRFKSAFRKVETRRRSQRELDRLLSRNDDIFRDIGIERADVFRASRDMKFL